MVSTALIQEATDSQSLLINRLMEEASLQSESIIIIHQPSSLFLSYFINHPPMANLSNCFLSYFINYPLFFIIFHQPSPAR